MESELGLKGEEGDVCPLDTKKGQKQCLIKEKHRIKSKTAYFNESGRYKDVNTLLNIVLCLLCGISVSFSGYFSYREIRLESRVSQLELELAQKFSRVDSILPSGNEVVIERLRREVEEKYQRRLIREISTSRRLPVAEEQPLLQDTLNPHERRRRDTADCICRPGKFYPSLLACQTMCSRRKKSQIQKLHVGDRLAFFF